jgi:Arc/MetJ-type ribon-helix-helix transcriptional regulator
MTVKTTLSFTDRHHQFLTEQVADGVFASQSAAVAAAIEQMMEDKRERDVALAAMADEIRERMKTPREEFITLEEALAPTREMLAKARLAVAQA